MAPIFIAWTRSFWLGAVPMLLIALDTVQQLFADPATAAPVAAVVAWALSFISPVSADQVQHAMQAMTPLFGLIALHQRSGAARPYTLDWRARQ